MLNHKTKKEMPNFSQRLYLAVLFSLFFAAIFIQIVLFMAEPMLLRDGVFYATLIQNHCDGGESLFYSDFNKPPLLLILASIFYRTMHISVEFILLAINFLAHALLIFPIASIAKRLFHSRATALFCAFLIILTPSLLTASLGGIREPLFMLLATNSIALIFAFCDNRKWPLLIAGGLCGALAFFARYEGLFLALIECGMLLGFLQPPTSWKQKLLYVALNFSSFMAGIVIGGILSPTLRIFLFRFWNCLERIW